jgi:uncharacterized coiled-coil protein SlyX
MLKKLRSLFIIEDEKKEVREEKRPATPTKKSSKSNAKAKISYNSPHNTTEGKMSQKFLNVFLEAMSKNNVEGFDYLEFKQSLKSLEKMSMDEKTRFQSAFAMAQTMGATPALLADSAQHYLKVLNSEEEKFGVALKARLSEKIGDKELQIEELNKSVSEQLSQIETLQKQIKESQSLVKKMESELKTDKSKIESTQKDFIATYSTLVGQIEDDIKKLNQYLK